MLPAIIAGVQAVGGIAQMFAGARTLKKLKRPSYEIPQDFNTNVGLAQNIKTMGMPKSEYQSAFQNIQRNQTAGINALQDRRSALAGIGSIVQRSNDASLNLDATAAKIANQNMLAGTQMEMGARQQLASQKLARQEWEKFQPYQQKLAQGQGMLGAGMQNAFGALQTYGNLSMMEKMAKGGVGGKAGGKSIVKGPTVNDWEGWG